MDQHTGVSRRFAAHLSAMHARGLDAAGRRAAGDLVLDGLAVAALGAGEPGPGILARMAIENGSKPAASLIGQGVRVSAAEAARANGAAMHVLDYEPMWNPANHSVSTTLPAILALAEARARAGQPMATGIEVLTTFAVGVETQARLRLSSRQFEPAVLKFHPPGTVGPLGSAVACGLLLGLDVVQLAHALGIAASRAGGLQANAGSMTKALHCGGAAAAGLEAAVMASHGFTADADALGDPRGYGYAFFGDGYSPEALTEPGLPLHIVEPGPAFKFYPSQYGTHFVITAALQARAKLPPGATVERVRILSPLMPYVDRPMPATGLAGKFSFQYVAAAALLDGAVTVGTFTDERRFAPDMVALLAKVAVEPETAREGRFDRMRLDIEVTHDRGTVTGHCDGPPGIWGRPAGSERVRAKARDCLIAAYGPQRGEAILAQASGFETLDGQGVLGLLEAMSPRGGSG